MTRKRTRRPAASDKRPYATPKLVVHGDIRAFTLAKQGMMTDGMSKPATRASGSNT